MSNRASCRSIVKAYAEDAGIRRINRNLSSLIRQFDEGRAQGTKDIKRIEKRRDINQIKANEAAEKRRKKKAEKLTAKTNSYPHATGHLPQHSPAWAFREIGAACAAGIAAGIAATAKA